MTHSEELINRSETLFSAGESGPSFAAEDQREETLPMCDRATFGHREPPPSHPGRLPAGCRSEAWITFYHRERPHEGIENLSQIQYAQQYGPEAPPSIAL